MKRDILGFYPGHNATVALVRDGKVAACVSEERFTGIKNFTGYPALSLVWLKDAFQVTPQTLENVTIPFVTMPPQLATADETKKMTKNFFFEAIYWGYDFARRLGLVFKPMRLLLEWMYGVYAENIAKRLASADQVRIAAQMGLDPARMFRQEHHLSHAYAAYYGSPYNREDALVLTLDGEGDTLSATVSAVRGGKWERLAASGATTSIGLLYMWLTVYLGMKANEHEYKVMGLAAYAKDAYIDRLFQRIQHLVTLDEANPLKWKSAIDTHAALTWMRKALKGERFDVISGAFQKLVEVRVVDWVKACIKSTGLKTLCLGGGVFMNVKVNMKVSQIPELDRLFIFPSCGDDSSAIGAAYEGYLKAAGSGANIEPIQGIYWGPASSNEEVEKFLAEAGVAGKYKVKRFEDIEDEVARLLAEGAIVARMSGAMEYGARALGNRSILANPANTDNVRVINEQMKNRDFWMPFAGSLLEERAGDYLENPKNIFSPYMMIGFPTKPLALKEFRAAIHPYDFTVRPQIVRQSYNPKYYALLKCFEKRTGIGGVLNTSFNLHGYPIVKGPAEAFHAFENSGIVHLQLENYLVSKA